MYTLLSTATGTIASLVLIELAGDCSLKVAADYANIGKPYLLPLAVGLISYALIGGIIYSSDRSGAMWGISNSYWNAFNNLVTPLVFMLVFGEVYSATQWVGFAVISLGILIVGMG